MDTWQLECIVAAAEHDSLMDAAAALDVSQPTLSRYINLASREIGKPLFTRENKLHLTAAGEIYVEGAKKVLTIKRHTYSLIRSMCIPDEETFSVGISSHSGSSLLSCIYDEYQSECPNVKLHIVEGYSRDLFNMVNSGKLDMCIAIYEEELINRTGIRFMPICSMPHLIGIADTNALAVEGAVSGEKDVPLIDLIELKNIPMVVPNERALSTDILTRLAESLGFKILSICRTSNYDLAIRMARSFNACTFIPEYMCTQKQGLRYYRSNPCPDIIKGFYVRKGFQFSRSKDKFMYLCSMQALDAYNQSYEDITDPYIRNIIKEMQDV